MNDTEFARLINLQVYGIAEGEDKSYPNSRNDKREHKVKPMAKEVITPKLPTTAHPVGYSGSNTLAVAFRTAKTKR